VQLRPELLRNRATIQRAPVQQAPASAGQ
jgi:hypothetical protein